MWSPVSISINNILSYKELKFDFIENKTLLILGQNGAGKSTLLESICLALTGNTIRKIRNKEIISNGQEEAEIEMILNNKSFSKNLRIKRKLILNQSTKVEVYVNDELQKDLLDLNPAESNKFILEQIGISYEDLINYFIIAKGKYTSFFLSSNTDKLNVINRFSKADCIDSVFEDIDSQVGGKAVTLSELNNKLFFAQGKEETYRNDLKTLSDTDYESIKKSKIEEFEKQKKENKDKIVEGEKAVTNIYARLKILLEESDIVRKQIYDFTNDKKLSENNKKIEEANKKISTIRLTNQVNIDNNFKVKIKKQKDLKQKYEIQSSALSKEKIEVNEVVEDMNKYLAGEIECPNCHHHFTLDKEIDLVKAKEVLKDAQDRLNDIHGDKSILQSKFDLCILRIENLEKEKTEAEQKAESDIATLKLDIIGYEREIEINNKIQKEFDEALSEISSEIKEKNADKVVTQDYLTKKHEANTVLDKNIYDESIKDYSKIEKQNLNKKISDVEKDIKNINKEIKNKNSQLEELSYTFNVFKKFKQYLANQSIKQIELRSNYYLSQMKSDLTVSIEGFRELSNKKLKEEINIELSRDGLHAESFHKFSNGEKSRADIACILAMQNLINMSSVHGGLNLCCIDEVCESIDVEGVNNLMKGLNNLKQTIIIIAHSLPNQINDCNKVTVSKINGFSEFIYG